MSTITAQILIGRGHQNHDGISHSHSVLQLSENSRPGWILKNNRKEVVWIPTVETMLEDGLLLIALNFVENKDLQELAKRYFTEGILKKSVYECEHEIKKVSERIDTLYDKISSDHLKTLHKKCKEINWGGLKIVICVLKDSHILNQLNIIREYSMDVEICAPIYTRLYSCWGNKVYIQGSLPEGGTVTIKSDYSVFEKLPHEITQNLELLEPTKSQLSNDVGWYEFGINTKNLIKEKANNCKKDIKQLMIECGYSLKSSRVDKFKEHQKEWNSLIRTIPKSYLAAIGISIEDIEKTIAADRQLYEKAISEVVLKYCKLGNDFGHFREIVNENKAIDLLKRYSKLRDVYCLIDYKDLKSIEIKPDNTVSIVEYTPEIKITKNEVGFKINPLIGLTKGLN
ncbi:MAG: hypothetical protein HQK79_20805 [Desulfobacterales bacterium]|nr:hypothetical protein [Desulfobacterales bacterium]